MEKGVLTKIEAVKLPWIVKFLYASGNIAKTTFQVAIMAFSLYFYTEIVGISPGVSSTIVLLAKIWDIINDPMMGAIVDRTKSKEGKCRFWLKYFSLPTGLSLMLIFFMPDISMTGKIIYVAVTYTLQGMVYTASSIPMNTLMGRITSDPVERAHMNQFSSIFSCIGSIAVPSLTFPLVMLLGKGDMQKGFLYVGIIYGIIVALFNLVVYWCTRGYEPLEHLAAVEESAAESGEKQSKMSIGDTVKALAVNIPWLLCIGLYLLDMTGQSIMSTVQSFYCQYNLENLNIMSALSLVNSGASLLSAFVLSFFIKRFGNGGTAVWGCALSIAGSGLRFLLHDANMVIMLSGSAIFGLGVGLVGGAILLCIFDAKVYGEWKTGVNNEAVLMSGFTVSYKIGMALGGPISGYLLMLVPYVANAESQAQSVKDLWFYESTLIPVGVFAIALVCAVFISRFEKKVPQMRTEIEERNQKASA